MLTRKFPVLWLPASPADSLPVRDLAHDWLVQRSMDRVRPALKTRELQGAVPERQTRISQKQHKSLLL